MDLARYCGRWYEVARIPNRFQRGCSRGTTATYTLRDDGNLEVLNRCIQVDGTADEARGVARAVDPVTNARLKVSFVRALGRWIFWGDYWVLALGADYGYAVVGTPDRRYGWVLARAPTLSPEQQVEIDRILRAQGYDPARFQPSAP